MKIIDKKTTKKTKKEKEIQIPLKEEDTNLILMGTMVSLIQMEEVN